MEDPGGLVTVMSFGSRRCSRCGHEIEPSAPRRGEVWLRVDSGKLYVITEEYGDGRSKIYGSAERLHPRGAQGCDPAADCAVWPDAVKRGDWIRTDGVEPTFQDTEAHAKKV